MFCMLKKKRYILLMFQTITQIVKKIILFMILNGEKRKWHDLAVKKLFALLRRITSKHCGDFCCLNCFHSFATENKLQSHQKVCVSKDFFNIIIPFEDTEILDLSKSKI